MNTVNLMNKGMQCLAEHLGDVDAERFIAVINREKFDYSEWRREYFKNMTAEEFHQAAIEYAKSHE